MTVSTGWPTYTILARVDWDEAHAKRHLWVDRQPQTVTIGTGFTTLLEVATPSEWQQAHIIQLAGQRHHSDQFQQAVVYRDMLLHDAK